MIDTFFNNILSEYYTFLLFKNLSKMKNNDIICNKTILENEVIEETNRELDELKSIFRISVDKMTDKQRRIADMYVEKMLEEADDLINSILD